MNNETLIISSDNRYAKNNMFDDDDGEANVGIIINTKLAISNDNGESFDTYNFYESNNSNCNGGSNICDSHGHFSLAAKDNILLLDMGTYKKNWVSMCFATQLYNGWIGRRYRL